MNSKTNWRPHIARMAKIAKEAREPNGLRVTAFAAREEYSTKTIHRDLDFLRERLNHDLVYDPIRFTWSYRTLPQTYLL